VAPEQPGEAPVALHPRYYLHNFLTLCATVQRQYEDILNEQEVSFLERFYSVEPGAQCLYVRLISRVGPWFRLAKLNYPEIGELDAPMRELVSVGLAIESEGLSVDELGRLFTCPELQGVYGELLPGGRAGNKAELLSAIEALPLDDGQHLHLLTTALGDQLLAPVDVEQVELLQQLFFGNRHQGLTDFVLSDLGLAHYYPYALNPQHRLFPCREALDEYLECSELQDIFFQFLELDDDEGLEEVTALMLEAQTCFAVNEQRWQRAWNSAAREMERRGQLEIARKLYIRGDRHPARERRARILEAQGDWPAVVALSREILARPWCEAEGEAATKILARARRKLGGKPERKPADQFRELKLTIEQSGEGVECDALSRLQGDWSSVHYVENNLMTTLFGLAFWQQIFADIPGAFHNPYQSVPRDMYEPEFVLRRRPMIEQRLGELRENGLKTELTDAYQRYSGYQCHWTDWRLVDEHLLATALDIIPREHLFTIWERLLFDPAENRSGFPDLIAFAEEVGDYCMIEVKGPGDALQNNQKRWLRYFSAHGIPAAVAWVEWDGAHADG